MTLFLTEDDVTELLGREDATRCVEESLRHLADGVAFNEPRHRTILADLTVNVMWSVVPPQGVLGVKAYPVARGPRGTGPVPTVLLHDFGSGELLAVIEGQMLGQLRTGAASAVATKALARQDAEILTVFGTGFQAAGQVLAIAPVLPNLKRVRIVGRDPVRGAAFAMKMQNILGVKVGLAEPIVAAQDADVIVTATRATEPVLLGEWVSPGVHINAVGSNQAINSEVDRGLLEKSALIIVDDKKVASIDCGDLLANDWDFETAVTLGDVLTGRCRGRVNDADVTLFESQGLAIWDIACAQLVYSRAIAAGRGLLLDAVPARK